MKFLNWLIRSSQDSTKISLTVKGTLTALVPLAVMASGILKLNIDNDQALQVVDTITILVSSFFTFVGAIVACVGFVRKFL